MSGPVALRNIPPHALQLAHRLCEQTGLSISDVLRQAIVSGLLVEATRFAPDPEGLLGGLEGASLAKALRRHLGSAIDLLVEYGQHPYSHQGGMTSGERHPPEETDHLYARSQSPLSQDGGSQQSFFEGALGSDLEILGIGGSLAETAERIPMPRARST